MRSRVKNALLAGLVILTIASSARAHGGVEHVMGTVKAIDESSITVTTKKGDQKISLDASTKFEKGTAAASAADVKPGARVVVHSKKSGEGLAAQVVKLGGAAPKKGAGAAPHH